MTNTSDKAERWADFIAGRPEFPAGAKLRTAFQFGKITRLCDCGCNAFEFEIPADASLEPLVKSGGGAIFEMSFETSEFDTVERKSIEFIVFADNRGHFSGIEVDYCGNSFPVPDYLQIHEPPYHVRCSPHLA